jgi:hypothetical protein
VGKAEIHPQRQSWGFSRREDVKIGEKPVIAGSFFSKRLGFLEK